MGYIPFFVWDMQQALAASMPNQMCWTWQANAMHGLSVRQPILNQSWKGGRYKYIDDIKTLPCDTITPRTTQPQKFLSVLVLLYDPAYLTAILYSHQEHLSLEILVTRLEEAKEMSADQYCTTQRCYASSDEDWDQYRKIIGNLFIGEDMSLRDVAKSMERNHNFKAT